jgi:hypothetical protein
MALKTEANSDGNKGSDDEIDLLLRQFNKLLKNE